MDPTFMKVHPLPDGWPEDLLKRDVFFVSLENLRVGPDFGVVEVYTDYWWVAHPEFGAVLLGRLPLCSGNPDVVSLMIETSYPGAKAVQLHKAYVPLSMEDYYR